jgi:uncharacterized membrane protein YczE
MRRYVAAFVAVLLIALGSAAYLTAGPRDALLTALVVGQ